MAHNDTQSMHSYDPIIRSSISGGFVFPVFEIGGLSPTPFLTLAPEGTPRDEGDHLMPVSGDAMVRAQLTREMLRNNTQLHPATFDLRTWEWSTTMQPTGDNNFITPRQRTLSLVTLLGAATSPAISFPFAASVPETLPSLFASSHTGDDEDDTTDASSLLFFPENGEEPQIRTLPSIPLGLAAIIIEPDVGFDAVQAFTDFEDLELIIAAMRIEDESAGEERRRRDVSVSVQSDEIPSLLIRESAFI